MTAPSSIDPAGFLHEQLASTSPDLERHVGDHHVHGALRLHVDRFSQSAKPMRSNFQSSRRWTKKDTRSGGMRSLLLANHS
jgi:putative transposase